MVNRFCKTSPIEELIVAGKIENIGWFSLGTISYLLRFLAFSRDSEYWHSRHAGHDIHGVNGGVGQGGCGVVPVAGGASIE